jgi:hypothetical protein
MEIAARSVHRHASSLLMFLLSLAVGLTLAQTPAPKAELRSVSFVRDSVLSADDRVIKLLTGSQWLLSRSGLILAASDVVIVLTGAKSGVLFYEGDQIPVSLLSGTVASERGLYGQVIESMGDGAVLRLNDQSLWEIPSYDRYDTGYWLPPYPVLITGGGSYLVNLKKGRRIWAKQLR